MLTSFFDRLALTLLERQVHDPSFVNLAEIWDRYVPTMPGERPDHLLGAYWDPVWFVPSSPERIQSVDTVNVCQYADLMCHVFADPLSAHYQDGRVLRSAEAAIDFCARRVDAGRPITNRCFDFGLLALAECVDSIGDEMSADVRERAEQSIQLAAGDLLGLYDVSDEPNGVHNHQAITGHTILLCGVVLGNGTLEKRGRQILSENLGYFDVEGVGNEHDRKYDMTVAGTLVRCYELTGEAAYLSTARRAARYVAISVTPSGEIVELTSHRPDCCGDVMVGYAFYAFHYLGNACGQGPAAAVDPQRDAGEDDHFAVIACRMGHYLRMKQRPDGLLPGFLYAQDGDFRCDKMDPYYMTGYGLPPMMWADRTPVRQMKGELPETQLQTRTERLFIYRRGEFQVCASGYNRRNKPRGLMCGPMDVLVVDHRGPGVWGLSCDICADGKWYGDLGGFTPRFCLSADAWNCRLHDGGWSVNQRLDVLDDREQLVVSLDCNLDINGDRVILSVCGEREGVSEWVLGPNLRAALGSLIFQHGHGSGFCRSLTDDHPFTGAIDLLANGRRLRVAFESEQECRTFLTPLKGKNHSLYERLVPGQVFGFQARVPGKRVNARWHFEAIGTSPTRHETHDVQSAG